MPTTSVKQESIQADHGVEFNTLLEITITIGRTAVVPQVNFPISWVPHPYSTPWNYYCCLIYLMQVLQTDCRLHTALEQVPLPQLYSF